MAASNTFADQTEEESWLESEPNWRYRLGEGWKGSKFLGHGGFGVAGLWEYSGNLPAGSRSLREVVVKQSVVDFESNLGSTPVPRTAYDEGYMLEMLSKLGLKHIIRMYGGIHKDTYDDGRGGKEVVRIYLEYCPGGTLLKIENPGVQSMVPIEEVDAWSIFHCLALGVAAMDRGTEDQNANSPDLWNKDTEICHFELKYDNVFIGYRDVDHLRIPMLKIADFGEAIQVPKTQDDVSSRTLYNRGDERWRPPEQNEEILPELKLPRNGTCSNIFQIGCIMHGIIIRTQKDDDLVPSKCKKGRITQELRKLNGNTYGGKLEDEAVEDDGFSETLRGLVMECMMQEPLKRPSSLDLQKRTAQGLQDAREESQLQDDGGFRHVPILETEEPPEVPLEWQGNGTSKEASTSSVEASGLAQYIASAQQTPPTKANAQASASASETIGQLNKFSIGSRSNNEDEPRRNKRKRSDDEEDEDEQERRTRRLLE